LGRDDDAAEHIGDRDEDGSREHGVEQDPALVRSDDPAAHVRNHESDEADGADGRGRGAREQGDRDDRDRARARHVRAER
jgi:hypothetical protein